MKEITIEEWRDIKGYEGLYQASNLGRIRSLNYGRTGEIKVLSPAKQRNGYMMVILAKNGEKRGFNIQRIIANTFIPSNQNQTQVNHINGDKTDNRAINLEWVTPKENINKAYKTGLKKTGKYLYNTRWIYQFDLNMNFIKKWESMSQAGKETNIAQADISKCCTGKRKSAGNYIWLNDDGVLNELEKYKHYYDELTTGQVQSSQLLKKYVSRDELEKYKELYVRTLGRTLNNSIAQSNKASDDLEALNEGWKIELEKKDKIIDAMAEEIYFMVNMGEWIDNNNIKKLDYKEEVKQYFERKVKDE